MSLIFNKISNSNHNNRQIFKYELSMITKICNSNNNFAEGFTYSLHNLTYNFMYGLYNLYKSQIMN